MPTSRKKIWGIALGCIILVLLWFTGFSFIALHQAGQGPQPTVVSLPDNWLVYQRLPDGRIAGFHRVKGSTGLFSDRGDLLWETSVFAPDYCWAREIGENVLIWSPLVLKGTTKMAFLKPDSSVKWQAEIPIYATGIPLLTDSGNITFVGEYKVISVSSDGEILWETFRPPTLNQKMLLHDDTFFVASSSGNLAALDLNGEIKWEQDYDLGIYQLTLIEEARLVLVHCGNIQRASIFAVDFQGVEQWRFEPPGGAIAGLVLGLDGLVYYNFGGGQVQVISQLGEELPARRFSTDDVWNLLVDRQGNATVMQVERNTNGPISKFFSGNVQTVEWRLERYSPDDKLLWSYRLDSTNPYLQPLGESGEIYVGVDNGLLMFEP